jgi:hypothetical protein
MLMITPRTRSVEARRPKTPRKRGFVGNADSRNVLTFLWQQVEPPNGVARSTRCSMRWKQTD